MQITGETGAGRIVLRVEEDRIDAAVAIQFKERMRDLIATPEPVVILDLSQVMFLDSSGLGAVVAVMKLLAPDRRLELAGLTPTVQKVFRLTRMDSVFTIHDGVPPIGLRHAG
jgi:anti-sigma B factor antagonist